MQWLIDLIIEAIGVPPCYIDRGTFLLNDFTHADLTQDGDWHELDFSGIVPAGATCMNLHFSAVDPNVGRILYTRPAGDGAVIGTCTFRNQVANVSIGGFIPMGISTNRKIEYMSIAPGYSAISIKVRGWWL